MSPRSASSYRGGPLSFGQAGQRKRTRRKMISAATVVCCSCYIAEIDWRTAYVFMRGNVESFSLALPTRPRNKKKESGFKRREAPLQPPESNTAALLGGATDGQTASVTRLLCDGLTASWLPVPPRTRARTVRKTSDLLPQEPHVISTKIARLSHGNTSWLRTATSRAVFIAWT